MGRLPGFKGSLFIAVLAGGGGLQACGGGCGGPMGDVCAGPPIGYAQLDARLLDPTETPIAGVAVWLSCGPAAGADHRTTDAMGRASIPLVHGEVDSTLVPLPPRDPAGGFVLPCLVWADLRNDPDANPRADSVAVYFAGPDASIVPTAIELRAE